MPRKARRVRIAVVFIAVAFVAFAAVKFVSHARQGRLTALPAGVNIGATETLVEKTAGDGNADPGDVLKGTITATNTGDTATGVTVVTTLPSELTLNASTVKASPVAADDSYTAPTGTLTTSTVATGILGNDFGIPAPTVSSIVGCAAATAPFTCATSQGGSVTVNADGTFGYTKKTGTTGTDTFTYTIGNTVTPPNPGTDDKATVSINITANQPPQITSDGGGDTATKSVPENTTAVTSVTATDPDNGPTTPIAYSISGGADALKFTIGSGTGVLTFNSAPDFDIPGDADHDNQYVVIVQASDGADTDQQTITVTVTNVNEAPVAHNDTATAVEAGGVNNGTPGTDITSGFNVITGTGTGSVADSDPDVGDTLTIKGVASGDQGATVQSSNVGLGISAASPNNFGTLTLASNGGYTYLVNNSNAKVDALRLSSQTLTDTFTYTLRDAGGLTSNATITITIQGANDNPVAMADTASATEAGGTNNGTLGTDPSGNVLTNDTDVDSVANGETKAVDAVLDGNHTATEMATSCPTSCNVGVGISANPIADYGTLTVQSDGSYTYVVNQSNSAIQALNTGDTLTDVFTYRVKDAAGATSVTTITITIHGADDYGVAHDDTATINEDAGAAPILVLTNDTDPDSTPTIGSKTNGAHGTVAITGSGSGLTYTPDANYCNSLNGTAADTFTYGLTPGSSTATVTVTVTCINDVPVAQNKPTSGTIDVMANMKRTGIDAGLTTNVSDADLNVSGCNVINFSVASITSTASTHGTITTHLASGTFDFDPDPGYTGPAVLNYTVSDDGCGTPSSQTSVAKTITLNVVGPVIWFVDPAAVTSGTGTLLSPFDSLASANTAKSTTASNRIFVYAGTTSGTGVTLTGNNASQATAQWLVGAGAVGTNFDTFMGITVPSGTITRPSINGTKPTIQGTVTLGDHTVADGLAISSGGSTGMTNTSGSNVTVGDTTITTTTGPALFISNLTSSTLTFSGITTSGGTGVSLTAGNSSSTFTFSNVNISIPSGANSGFVAAGGGTVTVTGSANTITSTTGTALNVSNTTIGASGLTFQSISSNGAASGIILNSTGTSGGLTVTGNGGSCTPGTPTCTGGIIQNTTSYGVSLTTTKGVSFSHFYIHDTAYHGIYGDGVDGLSYTDGLIKNFGNATHSTGEHAMDFESTNNANTASGHGLTGTVTIARDTFGPDGHFVLSPNPPTPENKGIVIRNHNDAQLTMTVTGTKFTQISNDGIDAETSINAGSAPSPYASKLSVDGSTADGANTFDQINGRSITFSGPADNSSLETLELFINNNTFNQVGIGGRWDASARTTMNARYKNNTMTSTSNDAIRSIADASDGSLTPHAITNATIDSNDFGTGSAFISLHRNATSTITFSNNTNIGPVGSVFLGSDRASSAFIDLLNNHVSVNADPNGVNAVYLQTSNNTGGNSSICANISGNTLTESGPNTTASYSLILDTVSTQGTINLEGWTGSPAYDQYLATHNTLTGPSPGAAADNPANITHTGANCVASPLADNVMPYIPLGIRNPEFALLRDDLRSDNAQKLPAGPAVNVLGEGDQPGMLAPVLGEMANADVANSDTSRQLTIDNGQPAENKSSVIAELYQKLTTSLEPTVDTQSVVVASPDAIAAEALLGGGASAGAIDDTSTPIGGMIAMSSASEPALGSGAATAEPLVNSDSNGQLTIDNGRSLIAELYDKLTASIEPTVYSKEASHGKGKRHRATLLPATPPTICIDNDADNTTCAGPGFTLPAGKSIKITYEATVKNGPFASGVDNLADSTTISWTGPTSGSTPASGSIALDAAPDLSVTADDSGATKTQPGVTIPYTITWGNTHTPDTSLQAASGAVISFTLPDYTTLNTTGSPDWTCTAASPPTPSICTTTITGPIAAGATGNVPLVLNVNGALPAAAAVVTLTPTIAETTGIHDNGTDLDTSNNSSVDTDLIIGVWTGAVSSNMGDPNNWSNDMLPTPGQNISIPGDALHPPTFTGTTTFASLYLSGNLDLGPGARIIVTSLLSLGPNKITGEGTVEIKEGATITRTTGQIDCLLQKDFASGAFTATAEGFAGSGAPNVTPTTFTYPVGDFSGYYPVDVTTASTGTLTVSTTQGDAGTVPPLDHTKTLQRYWTFAPTGTILADLTFTYAGSIIDGNEANYRPQRVAAGASVAFGDTCGGNACVDQDNDFIYVPNVTLSNANWTASDSASITTAAEVDVSGRVLSAAGTPLRGVRITLDDGTGHPLTVISNAFGYYHFDEVQSGSTYLLGASARGYTFTPQVVSVNDSLSNLDLVALP